MTTTTGDLTNLMNSLSLCGLKESMEKRLMEAMQEQMSYQDFLITLLSDEHLYRKNKRSLALRKRAQFKDVATLESFDTSTPRGITKSMIQHLQGLQFLKNAENIIFQGRTGVGKSYLAQAVGHAACMNGYETMFYSVEFFLKTIDLADKAGTYLNSLNKISKLKLLILDDFGLRNYSHQEALRLLQVLESRYRKGSTIITSQSMPEGWKALFEDVVIAEAIVDRLKSCAHMIEIKNGSYRSNHAPTVKIL